MRVLIIEDEAALADTYRKYLTELGHSPVVAPSAEAALASLTTSRPDAILLDLTLPGMSGLDFLHLPAVRGRSIPIVAISDGAAPAQADQSLQLGALDCLPKPISLERFVEAVGFLELHVLNKRHAERVRQLDRRRSPRVPVTLPVRVITYEGVEWPGESVDISTFGLKVRSDTGFDEGALVKLHFELPDASWSLMSVLVRTDPDGYAFSFVNLTAGEFQRLSEIVQTLLDPPR